MKETSRSKSLRALAAAPEDLLREAPVDDVRITGLSYDSRTTEPGDLFFCVPGAKSDGHDHAPAALARGAVALCVERPLRLGVAEIVVGDARRSMGRIAAHFYDHPASDLLVLGVTGTNGKTTTTFLLESILRAAGLTTGLIGTIETRVGSRVQPGVRTTPESVDLHRLLADMKDAGVGGVAMEVTSHALTLHRIESVRFGAAAFTNLSQDHLDFHRGMEDYFGAKRELFTTERLDRGAVNLDDPYGRRLYEETSVPCIGFGSGEEALVRSDRVRSGPWGSEFVMTLPPSEEIKISTPLVGHFNISNCLAATATALQADISPQVIESGIRDLTAVPGRFESVDSGQPFTLVVDYAHTPDSLDNVLRGAKALAGRGRVVCVFGCGGDRDRGKRPLMGSVVARLADVVVVTSDNPRSEDPQAIIDSIIEGVIAERADGPDAVLVDRREAIARAVSVARANDVVVIAGKGHETGQQFADHTVPFDDRIVAREELSKAGYGGRVE